MTSAIDGGEFAVVSWGGMFFSGRATLSSNPLMLIIPSLCILLMSMSFILLADALEQVHWQELQTRGRVGRQAGLAFGVAPQALHLAAEHQEARRQGRQG